MNTDIKTLRWQDEAVLTCIARNQETHDCASFEFAPPEGAHIEFLPGQFISLRPTIDGRAHFRAYSIASSPAQSHRLTLAIRRVEGGLVSNHLLDTLQPGASIVARAPAGEFFLDPARMPPVLLLLSAGCGVTPMLSMARAALESPRAVTIHFIHSAHDEANLIFADELQALARDHDRFKLHLFLSQPTGTGRVSTERLRALLPDINGAEAWLCGQNGYMDQMAAALATLGLPAEAIRREAFQLTSTPIAADAPRFRLSVPAFDKEIDLAAGETLLDALEREGLPIIGACRSGVCGSCKCQVLSGEVDSVSALGLTAEQQAAGYVLACSSTARGDASVAI